MVWKRQLVICLLGPLLALELSCHKSKGAAKPKLPGPMQAPTLTQTLPSEIQPEEVPAIPAETAQVEEPPQKPPRKRPRAGSRKSPPATGNSQPATQSAAPSSGAPNETTTAEMRPPNNPLDAAVEAAIGPDVSSPEASRDRQSTKKLLDETEKELKKLRSQSLSSEQRSMLTQIRAYISQSRKAITDGDYERASNLAKKAQLLTAELIKQ